MTVEDRFFEEVFRNELEMEHAEHLSFSVLWAYAALQLEASLAERVAVHVASCEQCFAELQKIRAERRELTESFLRVRLEPSEKFGRGFVGRLSERFFAPRVFYRHALAYASLGILILLINFWMNQQPTLLGPSERAWWALWVLGLWGILVALHGLRAFWRR